MDLCGLVGGWNQACLGWNALRVVVLKLSHWVNGGYYADCSIYVTDHHDPSCQHKDATVDCTYGRFISAWVDRTSREAQDDTSTKVHNR